MKAAFALLFLAVLVILPEETSGWWRIRKSWQRTKQYLKDKWSSLKQKIVDKLSKPKRDDEPLTDENLLEILATRNVHDMFEDGELDDSEREMLSEMQRYARDVVEDEDY